MIASCSEKEIIYYEFNGVTITRINDGNRIYFYHGKCGKDESCSKSYIKAEYSGLNSGMGAYLIFQPSTKVEIIKMHDSFEKVGNTSSLTFKEYDNIEFIPWQDSIKGKFENVIYVSDVIETEKDLNSKNRSKVKAVYPS